jgi:hypothetical protein
MDLDENKYVLEVLPPSSNMADDDPRGHYQFSSTLCGGTVIPGVWFPYTTLAFVDGPIPEGRTGTLSGSRTRTLPPLNPLDIETTETVTWSVPLDN